MLEDDENESPQITMYKCNVTVRKLLGHRVNDIVPSLKLRMHEASCVRLKILGEETVLPSASRH